jgi:DNA-binding NarL/FixJ family response regulator
VRSSTSEPRRLQAQFVLTTADDMPGLAAEARRLGVAGYLPKPFLGTALLDVVRAFIAAAGG